MTINVRELRARRADLVQDMRAMNDTAELEDRDFNEHENATYQEKLKTVEALEARINRLEAESQIKEVLETRQAPATLKGPRVDSESRIFAQYLRTGDEGIEREIRASNAANMTIGAAAAGGYAVPTGHYQNIIARRNEVALFSLLGVQDIPGVGTTVDVPIDDEADGEFIATNEEGDFDHDSPALGTVAMTLVTYTKKVVLSHQLLADEDSRLLSFLENFVGRGMAKTENALLVAAVNAGGTALKTFAATTAIAAGELESLVYNNTLAYYLDNERTVAWVTTPSTFGAVASISGDARLYAETPAGSFNKQLLGYQVKWSNKVEAMTAGKKSLLFGNWNYVGRRENPGFTVLRDPYSLASKGQVAFHYYFRTVYKVLQAGAIGYGIQDDGL